MCRSVQPFLHIHSTKLPTTKRHLCGYSLRPHHRGICPYHSSLTLSVALPTHLHVSDTEVYASHERQVASGVDPSQKAQNGSNHSCAPARHLSTLPLGHTEGCNSGEPSVFFLVLSWSLLDHLSTECTAPIDATH